jgi:hypothetical protein
MKQDFALLSMLAGLMALGISRADVGLLNGVETQMQAVGSIGTIAFIQSVLGGNSMVEHPKKLKKILKNKGVRFALLYFTSFSVVRDLEIALIISLAYMVFMQLLRTPEERKKYPYMI